MSIIKSCSSCFIPLPKNPVGTGFNCCPELATWGELDLDIKEDAIVLNGMTYADPDASLFLGAFRDQSPVKMELHEIMPSGTSYFLHLGISDRSKFKEQIMSYFTWYGNKG